MAITNIVVANGATPPVNQTFEVYSSQVNDSNPASFLNKVSGSVRLYERAQFATRRAASNASYIIQGHIFVPRDKTINGLSVTPMGHIDFKITIPDEFTQADRDDLAAYVKNFLAAAIIQDAIKQIKAFN